MKKVFVEPKMNRIELNLKENIASSITIQGYCFHGHDMLGQCDVHETGYNIGKLVSYYPTDYMYLLASCVADGSSDLHGNETIIPEETVMRYIGR